MDEFFDLLMRTEEQFNTGVTEIAQIAKSLWILGHEYDPFLEIDEVSHGIRSKLWFTYRKGFPPIGDIHGPTSDKGWGCMLRCGQMLLAQALITTHLPKGWRWTPDTVDVTYLKILALFEDTPHAPFSIHRIASAGCREGKQIGEWFGPNTIAQVLKKLVENDDWCSLKVHVAMDNLLIKREIYDNRAGWKPLLLIVPLRLGLNEINPIYCTGIRAFFELEHSVGLIGGKPNSALYFIGYYGDNVMYLDPHTTQKVASVGSKQTNDEIEADKSYHCKTASRMPILSMDPSVALCFYCKTENEFKQLCEAIGERLLSAKNQQLIEIYDERPKNLTYSLSDDSSSSLVFELDDLKNNSSDDFEII